MECIDITPRLEPETLLQCELRMVIIIVTSQESLYTYGVFDSIDRSLSVGKETLVLGIKVFTPG